MEDELILDMTKTYIYEGEEYILTGRTADAIHDVPPPIKRRSKRPILVSGPEKEIMVEITPAPKNTGSTRAVGVTIDNRWVNLNDLFIIRDQLDENYEEEEDA